MVTLYSKLNHPLRDLLGSGVVFESGRRDPIPNRSTMADCLCISRSCVGLFSNLVVLRALQ
ncbi:hypothetical protein ZOSMA_255G00160 [Zostera marina]|uniref:Uncharacterized protein n=1 Tax=Zostera marina TaxID=29655 RepID=A0A0K9PI04_ZOSMR|nr:hypothetical protein ZOSMA_255G00160 [Zostera marina]